MTECSSVFANNLKSLLKQKNKSRSELAVSCRVTGSAVNKWLNGLSIPDHKKIDSICGFLGISPAELFMDKLSRQELLQQELKKALTDIVKDVFIESLNGLGGYITLLNRLKFLLEKDDAYSLILGKLDDKATDENISKIIKSTRSSFGKDEAIAKIFNQVFFNSSDSE